MNPSSGSNFLKLFIMKEWQLKEIEDTLYMVRATLLGLTGLDSKEEIREKSILNETAITRRIDSCIEFFK